MSSAPAVGSRSVTLRAGGARWREIAELLFRYLGRDMSDAEACRVTLYPDTGADHVPRTIALVWRLARELSTLYLRPPSRTFVGASAEQTKGIEQVYKRSRFNRRARTAQEQVSAIGNATMWCWLTSDGFRWIVPPVHEQWVTPSRIDASEVEDIAEWRVRFPVVTDPYATTVSTATALITPTRAVWESGPKGWVGTGIWAKDGSNPFGCIPVIMLRASDPAPGEWWASVPEDLLDAQRAVNHDLTDVGEFARKQGFGQAVAKGIRQGQASEIEVGAEKVVCIEDPAGSFGFASPGADLNGCIAQMRAYVELVIATTGLNPATVMKSAGITALAKIIEVMDREVERIRHKDEFELAEQRGYELMAMASALRAGGLPILPDNVTVTVEYREPVMPADPTSAAQAGQMLIDQGRETAATLLAYERGISLEDAKTRVGDNLAFTAGLKAIVAEMLKALEPKPPQVVDQVGDASAPADPNAADAVTAVAAA